MFKSGDCKGYWKSAAGALLLLTCSGCPRWYAAFRPHGPPSPPPSVAGRGGSGSAGSGASSSGDPATPILPKAQRPCPTLETGTLTIGEVQMQLWVGAAKPGHAAPLVVYWHGTGSSPAEVTTMFSSTLDEILAEGGIVAAPASTTGRGLNTSTGVWYTGDLASVDELVACAVAQREIDPRRIYTSGCSSGGVQAGALANARSNYIAAALLNSGGLINPIALQDPARVPAAITAHGASDVDVVIVDFAEASVAYDDFIVENGGFAVDCQHSGGHCGAPSELVKAQWEFAKAHPYGVSPEPYAAGLPASFPAYCKVVQN